MIQSLNDHQNTAAASTFKTDVLSHGDWYLSLYSVFSHVCKHNPSEK